MLPNQDIHLRGARAFSAAALLSATAIVIWVISTRIGQTIELEWMTGSILDHIERIQRGLPVYQAPTADWIPFLYPPGYYWVVARIAGQSDPQLTARLVSVAATVLGVVMIYLGARALKVGRFWSLLGAGLFIGCFSFLERWFDIERCDPLFVSVLGLAFFVLVRVRAPFAPVIAGALIGLNMYVKQPSLFFLAATIGLFVLTRRWRDLATFMVGFLTVFVPLWISLQHQSDGWFARYCWDMPRTHGIDKRLISLFLVKDQADAFLFTVVGIIAVVTLFPWRKPLRENLRADFSPDLVLLAWFAAAWAASGSSRMHLGGFRNCDAYWIYFGCIATAVVGERTEAWLRSKDSRAPFLVHALVALQVLSFLEDPVEWVPEKLAARGNDKLHALVRSYEQAGKNVLIAGRGHVALKRNFHMAALVDVLRTGAPLPDSFTSALRNRQYGAIFLNGLEEYSFEGLLTDEQLEKGASPYRIMLENYFVAGHVRGLYPPVVGFRTFPQWVMHPRATPLSGIPTKALVQRQRVEAGLALARSALDSVSADSVVDTIEQDAAKILAELGHTQSSLNSYNHQ
ncbi:MAG: DUF2029 domain-containing protein [Polyangiaceae bacterium]|nr:DUF2029 domain-containing protein [Polyangiaceae bacterium]